jgi:hypothetical protein
MDQKVNLEKAPKQFCENITAAFSPEHFILSMQTGGNAIVYAITPQHAKRLAQYMSHQVLEYEKQNGEINAKWDPNIKSPIQINFESDAGKDAKN